MTDSSGLVLDIDFAEKSGAVAGDASRYGNDGALTGCKWVEHGLEFNGSSDYVDCGNDGSLNITTGGVSVCLWVKSNQRSISRIFEKSSPGYYNLWSAIGDGKLRFVTYDGANVGSVYTTSEPLDGDWHHIVCVRNTGLGKVLIYVDGSFEDDGIDSSVDIDSSGANFIIGTTTDLDIDRYFKGSINDIRIYNHALNASEIKAYYDSTKHRYK